MKTKFGEVYYAVSDEQPEDKEKFNIEVFRSITLPSPFYDKTTICFKDMECDRYGYIEDGDIYKSNLTGLIPHYTLKLTYIGYNNGHRGYKLTMTKIEDNKDMFSPTLILDAIDENYFEQEIPSGTNIIEAKLYAWESFNTIHKLLLNTPLREDVKKAHRCPVSKSIMCVATSVFKEYGVNADESLYSEKRAITKKILKRHFPESRMEPAVPCKLVDIIDLILEAINVDLDVKILPNTKINPVTSGLYRKGTNPFIRYYDDIQMYESNAIKIAYGIKYDLSINIKNVNQEHILIRNSSRSDIWIIPYVTTNKKKYMLDYETDEETRDIVDFLNASIGVKKQQS